MKDQKKQKRKSKSQCSKKMCLGNLILEIEEYPVFVCESCGERYEGWKKFYEEYLQLYKTRENWNVPANRVSCVLGLFCFLYQERYKTDYVFVPHGPNPFSEKECRDANIMIATFEGDMVGLRKYLIWSFRKGLGSNISITSLAYLNTPNLIRRFKLVEEKSKSFTRYTELPSDFLEWCRSYIPSLFESYTLETMNDLGALLNHVNTYDLSEQSVELQAINKSAEFNLIKNGKLNIEG